MDKSEAILLGDSAVRVLDEPAFKDAMSKVEAALLQAFKDTPVRDLEGLQLCRQSLGIFYMIRSQLIGAVETGKFEKLKLEEQRKDTKVGQLFKRYA